MTIHAQGVLFAVAALLVLTFCYLFVDPDLRSQWVKAGAQWKGRCLFLAVLFSTAAFVQVATTDSLLKFFGRSAESGLAVLGSLLVLFQLGLFFYFVFRRRWAGNLLVDARVKGWRWYPWLSAIMFIIGGSAYVQARAYGVTLGSLQLVQIIYFFVLAMFAWLWFGTQEFRQRGIVIGQGLIRWEKIRGWHWETRGPAGPDAYSGFVAGSKLRKNAVLHIDLGLGLSHKAPLQIAIPPAKVDEVSAVLDRYLGEWPGVGGVATPPQDDSPDPRSRRRLRYLIMAVFALDAIGILVALNTQRIDRYLMGSSSALPAVMSGTAAWIQVFNDEWFNMPGDDAPLVSTDAIPTA